MHDAWIRSIVSREYIATFFRSTNDATTVCQTVHHILTNRCLLTVDPLGKDVYLSKIKICEYTREKYHFIYYRWCCWLTIGFRSVATNRRRRRGKLKSTRATHFLFMIWWNVNEYCVDHFSIEENLVKSN